MNKNYYAIIMAGGIGSRFLAHQPHRTPQTIYRYPWNRENFDPAYV